MAKKTKTVEEREQLYVDYVHRSDPSKNGSCPKIEFTNWAQRNNGFIYYKIIREYYKSTKSNIPTPPEAQEIIDNQENQE